jgi:hypothetical protein
MCRRTRVFADVDRNGRNSVFRNDACQRMIHECSQMSGEEIKNNPEHGTSFTGRKALPQLIFSTDESVLSIQVQHYELHYKLDLPRDNFLFSF